MRIELTTERAGTLRHDREGDVIDVPEAEARRLIASGQAVECAAVAPRENAAAPAHRPTNKRTRT